MDLQKVHDLVAFSMTRIESIHSWMGDFLQDQLIHELFKKERPLNKLISEYSRRWCDKCLRGLQQMAEIFNGYSRVRVVHPETVIWGSWREWRGEGNTRHSKRGTRSMEMHSPLIETYSHNKPPLTVVPLSYLLSMSRYELCANLCNMSHCGDVKTMRMQAVVPINFVQPWNFMNISSTWRSINKTIFSFLIIWRN